MYISFISNNCNIIYRNYLIYYVLCMQINICMCVCVYVYVCMYVCMCVPVCVFCVQVYKYNVCIIF